MQVFVNFESWTSRVFYENVIKLNQKVIEQKKKDQNVKL